MDKQQAIASLITAMVVCFIGVPIWWHTTTTYRADIPYHELFTLKNEEIPGIKTTWKILLDRELFTLESKDMFHELSKQIRKEIEHNFVDSDTEVSLTNATLPLLVRELVNNFTGQPSQVLKLDNELHSLMFDSGESDFSSNLLFRILFVKSSTEFLNSSGRCRILVGSKSIIILSGNSTLQHLKECAKQLMISFTNLQYSNKKLRENHTISNQLKMNRTTTQTASGYQIAFTLANSNPHEVIVEWEIEKAVEDQLSSFLEKLSFLGPFSISSQILNFVDVALTPRKSDSGYLYSMKQLPLLINSLESRLNTYTSNHPILNFVLYIPPCYQMPLGIKSKKRRDISFISSRWGGVIFKTLRNCSQSEAANMYNLNIEKEMLIFISHLRELIGLKRIKEDDIIFSAFDGSYILEWEVNYLILERTYQNLQKSMLTLSSLTKLLKQISNIVIRDDVKELIVKAMDEIKKSKILLRSGDLKEAFNSSKSAFIFSEKAFFDHSLLALLYFPDDQKYAIYLPLFLPICFPIVISLVNAVRSLKNCHKKDKDD